MTEHALERGPAGLQSACFPGKREQCEVVAEVRGKQRTLSNFGICNPKPHTFSPFCFQRQTVPWQLAFENGAHGKAPVRNTTSHRCFLFSLPWQFTLPLQSWVWQPMTTIPELGSWTQENQKFTAIPSYWPSSRLAWTLWDPHLKQQSKTIVLIREDFYNPLLPVFCWHLSGNPASSPHGLPVRPSPQSLPGFHGLINAPFSLCPVLGKHSTEPRTLVIFLSHFPQDLSPSVDMFWPAMYLTGRERALFELDSWDKKVQIHGFSRHFFFQNGIKIIF